MHEKIFLLQSVHLFRYARSKILHSPHQYVIATVNINLRWIQNYSLSQVVSEKWKNNEVVLRSMKKRFPVRTGVVNCCVRG